jgi:serine/threonine protein kinase
MFTLTVIVAVIALALWIRRRTAMAETLEDWELDHPHRLPYKELYTATKGFEASELLGAGGFGQVYRGVLRRSGDVVAIKRISSSGTQGLRTFVAEVASLGRMRHRNLVDLRGWCKRGQDLLLVYEFMPNGSLDEHLFGCAGTIMPPKPLLTWVQRFRILRGVASGLVYLHEEWEQVVVHRDVKASNVLLGADMSPRLGDFGLARLYEHGADPATTRVVGTLGYMAPELAVTAKASRATDVFAFGVLLLEVACGRRPIDPVTGDSLLRRVRDHGVGGDLVRAVDERLDGCYDKEEAKLVLWLGLMCSQSRPEARPSMRQVCQYLDGELEMQEEAVLVFPDVDSVDDGSLASMTWSSCSCNTMSGGSLLAGR